MAVPVWLEAVQQGYEEDVSTQKLLIRLATEPEGHDSFKLQNGIIRQHGHVWLGNNITLQKKVLEVLHAGVIGGHSGFNATYHRVRRLFTWLGMKQHIMSFVEECQICKQAKPERVRYPGLWNHFLYPNRRGI